MTKLNKLQLSGIAILMVILTHTGISVFYPGFIGVDIFFFLSGYYLCLSFKTHSIIEFYKRRYRRIIPMFLLLATIMSILNYYTYNGITIFEVIENLTTISYYTPSSNFVDWYLSSLFVFYLIFPLLWLLMSNKWNLLFLCIILISVFSVFALFDLHWRYECALGRIPVFCMGIMSYHQFCSRKGNNKPLIFAIVSLILVIPAIMLYKVNKINTYYLFYLLAPLFILILNRIISKVTFNKTIDKLLYFLGKYSLEIYVANIIALNTYYYLPFYGRAWSTILLTFILGTICIGYNTVTDKIIKKYFKSNTKSESYG